MFIHYNDIYKILFYSLERSQRRFNCRRKWCKTSTRFRHSSRIWQCTTAWVWVTINFFLWILAIYKLILETFKFHFQTSFQLMSCFTALLPPPPNDYIPPKDQKQQNFMRFFDTFMLPYSFYQFDKRLLIVRGPWNILLEL